MTGKKVIFRIKGGLTMGTIIGVMLSVLWGATRKIF